MRPNWEGSQLERISRYSDDCVYVGHVYHYQFSHSWVRSMPGHAANAANAVVNHPEYAVAAVGVCDCHLWADL